MTWGAIMVCGRAFLALFLFVLLSPDLAHAASAQTIGVIQYNVKSGQRGWTTQNDVLDKQTHLVTDEVKSAPVDFIALEQAPEKPGVARSNISVALAKDGVAGWKTIISRCELDVTQLAYSPDWQLVVAANTGNPLVDGLNPQYGWIPRGCGSHHARPFNIAYFHNAKSGADVLFVINHLPHCGNTATCTKPWDVGKFKQDVKSVVGAGADLTKIRLIAAGDMNELGGSDDAKAFDPLFSAFGALQISTNLLTCCADSSFQYSFDRLVANSADRPKAIILDGVAYPINPDLKNNEEHKAIYGVVSFPASP